MISVGDTLICSGNGVELLKGYKLKLHIEANSSARTKDSFRAAREGQQETCHTVGAWRNWRSTRGTIRIDILSSCCTQEWWRCESLRWCTSCKWSNHSRMSPDSSIGKSFYTTWMTVVCSAEWPQMGFSPDCAQPGKSANNHLCYTPGTLSVQAVDVWRTWAPEKISAEYQCYVELLRRCCKHCRRSCCLRQGHKGAWCVFVWGAW